MVPAITDSAERDRLLADMAPPVLQYFLLVFCVACGILQAVFAFRRVRGLQLFQSRALSYGFAAVFGITPFVWFYAESDRNVLPVIEGAQQSGLFIAGIAAAVAVTAAVSSLVNARRLSNTVRKPGEGLGCLHGMTWWQYACAVLPRRHGTRR